MGYRNYIGYIPKKDYNKIKSLSVKQVCDYYNQTDEDTYINTHKIVKEIYEFGKDVDFNPPKKSIKPFFKNKETQKQVDVDDEFNLVTKEFLEYIIDSYNQKIKKYYNDMVDPFYGARFNPSEFLYSVKTEYDHPSNKYSFDFSKITDVEQTALYKILEHVRSMRTEWTILTPYNLINGDNITTSWKFEYAIFELVRIYKTFDWKKNVMVYYGY